MTDRQLDPKVSVAPQIAPDDLAAFKEAGFTSIVCNRPDTEVAPEIASEAIREAAEALGLVFVNNPLRPGMLDIQTITTQRKAIGASSGRVLAYCASGTRSAVLWAFAAAMGDELASQDILSKLENAGYPMPGLAAQLDQVRGMSS